MDKIVVYLRVSTELQDYDRQLLDLQNWANGRYVIDKVFAEKMSGRKDERPELLMMKQYLTTNDVKFVATWELSRLSRNKITLLQMFEWFQENQIQLFLFKQNTYLLDGDGKIASDVDLLLTILSHFAESEVVILRERVKSKMGHMKVLGLFTGGQIPLGYKVENGKLVADEVNAPIVTDLFEHYIKDGESLVTTMKYCLLTHNINITKTRLRNIFHRECYKGVGAERIVSDELFQKAVEKCAENKTKAKGQKRKQARLLNYLIKCPECGSNFASKSTTDMYCCSHSKQYGTFDYANLCNNSVGISCNHLDSIVWKFLTLAISEDDEFFEKLNIESEKAVEIMEVEIDNIKANIATLNRRIGKENAKFDNDAIDLDTYTRSIKELKKSIKEFESEIAVRKEKIKALQNNRYDHLNRYDYISNIKEFGSIRELVMRYVEEVNVYKIGQKRSERKIRIKLRVFPKYYHLYVNVCSRPDKDGFYQFFINDKWADIEVDDKGQIIGYFSALKYSLLNFSSLKESRGCNNEKQKRYAAEWRAKNREKKNAYQREWLKQKGAN